MVQIKFYLVMELFQGEWVSLFPELFMLASTNHSFVPVVWLAHIGLRPEILLRLPNLKTNSGKLNEIDTSYKTYYHDHNTEFPLPLEDQVCFAW